uniref:Uncharacterized protein n=1 Tax=Opuntia streptacantha TaxID=393608 RepID=A0A7C9CI76_OPUST
MIVTVIYSTTKVNELNDTGLWQAPEICFLKRCPLLWIQGEPAAPATTMDTLSLGNRRHRRCSAPATMIDTSASATGDSGKRLNVVGFHSAGGEEATREQRKTGLCHEGREREALGDSSV